MAKYLTPEGLEKIKKELEYLKTTKRKELSEQLRHAISFGDLKENAAYSEAKDAQGFLEGRILELQKIVSEAKVIEKKNTGKVQVGSEVSLKSTRGEDKFQIVEPEEADIMQNRLSKTSPLGKLLLGKTKGDKVKISMGEEKTEYEITNIK